MRNERNKEASATVSEMMKTIEAKDEEIKVLKKEIKGLKKVIKTQQETINEISEIGLMMDDGPGIFGDFRL